MPVPTETRTRNRAEIADTHKWQLDDIYPDWKTWESAFADLEHRIGEYAKLKGTLAHGPDKLLAAYRLNDDLGQLAYKVYFFPSLKYDEDQRDNQVNARRQQVQALMARWQEATSWLSPELLAIPLKTVQEWMGWSDKAFVLYYSHATKKSREEAGRSLEILAGRKTG